MQQRPSWKADCTLSHSRTPTRWYPKFHHRLHNSSPPIPVLSHMKPVHSVLCHFHKAHFNIIFLSTPSVQSVRSPLGYAKKRLHAYFISIMNAVHVTHTDLMILVISGDIWWRVQIMDRTLHHSGCFSVSNVLCIITSYTANWLFILIRFENFGEMFLYQWVIIGHILHWNQFISPTYWYNELLIIWMRINRGFIWIKQKLKLIQKMFYKN
jgi:hypothetical protein